MKQSDQTKSEDIRRLRDDYQVVKAPAGLAQNVFAQIEEQTDRGFGWKPVFAGLLLVVGSVILLAPEEDSPVVVAETPAYLSLGGVALVIPEKPAVKMPTLSRIRSVKTPSISVLIPAVPPNKT